MALSAAARVALKAAITAKNYKMAREIATTNMIPKIAPAVDQRVAEAARRSGLESVQNDLQAQLLRRWQRGKPVPSWFDPIGSKGSAKSPLMNYNTSRLSAGMGGMGGQRTPLRSLDDSLARLNRVEKGVGATQIPKDKIKELQDLCGVSDNPMVCAKVSDLVERNLMYVKQLGFYRGQQHAWNVMPDGTIVDATAAQFRLPDINVVPPGSRMQRDYRPFTKQQVQFEEDRVLWEPWAKSRSNEDYASFDYGRRKFDPDMDNNNWSTFRDDWEEMASQRAAWDPEFETDVTNPLEEKEALRRLWGSWGG